MSNLGSDLPNILSALASTVLDNKTFDEALKEVGLSESYFMEKYVDPIMERIAPQSSAAATEYVKELIKNQLDRQIRTDADVYVVKKVYCKPEDYETMTEVVNGQDTDKFKVLRLIGSDPQAMRYKQKRPGLEFYLVKAKTPIEAMRQTTSDDPTIQFTSADLDAELAKELDELATGTIYEHTPESFKKMFERAMELLDI